MDVLAISARALLMVSPKDLDKLRRPPHMGDSIVNILKKYGLTQYVQCIYSIVYLILCIKNIAKKNIAALFI